MTNRLTHRLLVTASVCAVGATGLTAAVTASAHSTPARAAQSTMHMNMTRPAATGKTVVVVLKDEMFSQMTVRIKPGDTVKWEWKDGRDGVHNITPLHKKGGLLFKGTGDRSTGSYSVKFTKKGTYYYECSIHPLTMQAKIIVS